METFIPNQKSNSLGGKSGLVKIVVGGVILAALIFAAVWFLVLHKTTTELFKPIAEESSSSFLKKTTVQNPITGEMVADALATSWVNARPLATMIDNHVDARPQSGLIYADVVYEVVAEGGITRYIAFFLSNTPTKIGPIRSTREYYLVLVKELGDAMLMHIGYSPQAQEAIATWPIRSLFVGGADFTRDTTRNVATEHTAYVNGLDLRTLGDKLGWQGNHPFDSWKFKDDVTTYSAQPAATHLEIDFWAKGDYSAVWDYDTNNNSYKRSVGFDSAGKSIPHLDNETKQQISVKNVVVQFAKESAIQNDPKNRLDYVLVGSGSGLIFEDGKVIKATW
ncbi:MAG TPA: DUF3048 domain-containing protein, partial [Candidatus Saccharimonadales bacterium]|nr:DUF3048 domain-containing protein [Candidatus Saccharimonadales bacterium]